MLFPVCVQALIPLAVEGTDVGKIKASHALAKIAAISNPDIAFPGERVSLKNNNNKNKSIDSSFSKWKLLIHAFSSRCTRW